MKSNITKNQNFIDTRTLFHFVIEAPKEESVFIYFILEVYSLYFFYSTLNHEAGQLTRLIDLKGPIEHQEQAKEILQEIRSQVEFSMLVEDSLKDL